jgi:peptidoglycan/xylan/chitin deacetylase (PgdA/CDA1 family)
MSNAQRRRRVGVLAGACSGALVITVLLSGCAPDPVAGWHATGFSQVPGIELVSDSGVRVDEGAEQNDTGITANSGDGEAGSDEDRGPVETAQPLAAAAQKQLGLYTGRIRNDEAGVAARFIYIPGVPAFNERVNQEIRRAITATGKSYTPRVYAPEQGRTERGCVPGSSSWPATDVLSRVETGPAGGVGIALVCDLAGAYGDLIEVRLRTVVGDANTVTSDELTVLFVNVVTGQLQQISSQWNPEAAPELWRAVVELLRREAGALSTAPILDPDAQQLALADAALQAAATDDDGSLVVTVPPGIASPELAGLGIESTTEPIELRIDPVTAAIWANEEYAHLHAEIGKPFVGISAGAASVPIDCGLIPCVAVTYDDGPGELTPKLLQTYKDEGARATFFMLGSRASARPDLVKRAQADGHELASHTMTHPDLTAIAVPEAKAQVLNAAAVISGITGVPVTMFRPPYGEVNDAILAEVGIPAILWNVDTNDWREPGQAALIERSVGAADPGDIILFHDTHADTVEVAGAVVRGLRDRGLELVTVTQLFGGQVPGGKVRSR